MNYTDKVQAAYEIWSMSVSADRVLADPASTNVDLRNALDAKASCEVRICALIQEQERLHEL